MFIFRGQMRFKPIWNNVLNYVRLDENQSHGLLGCNACYFRAQVRHFGGPCWLHLQDGVEPWRWNSRFVLNVDTNLPNHAESQPFLPSKQLYSPRWALASSTTCLLASRFLALSFHLLTPIFRTSMDTTGVTTQKTIIQVPLYFLLYCFNTYVITSNCSASSFLTKKTQRNSHAWTTTGWRITALLRTAIVCTGQRAARPHANTTRKWLSRRGTSKTASNRRRLLAGNVLALWSVL